jgi:hypothetical protein
MPIRLPLPAIALCLLPFGSVQAQYPTADNPARTLLVGRRETASVELARLGTSAMDDLLPWRHRQPPLADGTGTSARFWSDLPVTIGTLVVPAGTHLLRFEAPGTLLITSQGEANRFSGRVELSERSSGMQVHGWALAVVTSRLGDDTLSVAEASVRGMNVTTIRHGPGTRSVLRLRYLDREWSVPIAAR